ncbi:MAG: hypothetical protein OEY94_02325 [Alphaproteobacteria bacterium]|nr:hypothetical protein [Alphaproteobacteria bacterium]
MINVIGIRRIFLLGILIVLNASIGALVYLYLVPMQDDTDRSVRRLRSDVRNLKYDIDQIKIEFEQLDEQQNRFDALKETGFFDVQDRSTAKEIFNEIQNQSQVISAVVSVKSGTVEENKEAQKANHKILYSPIEIEIEAFDDSDIYRYIDLAQKNLPGHLSVDYIEISRTRDISPTVLRAIAAGASPVLIKSLIKLSWRTIIPESQVITPESRNR